MKEDRTLKGMVEFCLKIIQTPFPNEFLCFEQEHSRVVSIERYAQFLSQPIELWMFIPCGKDGKPLEKPKTNQIQDGNYDIDEREQYQAAQDRVIFEGFNAFEQHGYYCVVFEEGNGYPIWVNWNKGKVISDLLNIKPVLTRSKYNELFK